MTWYLVYGYAYLAAFCLTLAATPLCKMLARHVGMIDVPKLEQHKRHAKSTPLLGGLAMFAGWSAAILCGLAIVHSTLTRTPDGPFSAILAGVPTIRGDLFVILAGAFASMLLGLADDRKPMKAHTKFLGQLLIAVLVVFWGGIRISLFIDNQWVASLITIFWILFLFNAINFFDNMDGLAVGTAAIALVFFTVAAAVNQQYFVASLAACSAAAACAFWLFNRAPASIFMGDAGSHFLGFLLAVISVKVTYYNPEFAATQFTVLIPIFILAVPIFDTFAVVVIRLVTGQPIYKGDHNHISHRFHHMGMSRKRAVQMVHLLAIIAGLGAIPLLWGDLATCVILVLQECMIFLILSVLQYVGRRPEEPQKQEAKTVERGA